MVELFYPWLIAEFWIRLRKKDIHDGQEANEWIQGLPWDDPPWSSRHHLRCTLSLDCALYLDCTFHLDCTLSLDCALSLDCTFHLDCTLSLDCALYLDCTLVRFSWLNQFLEPFHKPIPLVSILLQAVALRLFSAELYLDEARRQLHDLGTDGVHISYLSYRCFTIYHQ